MRGHGAQKKRYEHQQEAAADKIVGQVSKPRQGGMFIETARRHKIFFLFFSIHGRCADMGAEKQGGIIRCARSINNASLERLYNLLTHLTLLETCYGRLLTF